MLKIMFDNIYIILINLRTYFKLKVNNNHLLLGN